MANKQLKITVKELTYAPDGRQYLPGDTVIFESPYAEIAAEHYGKKVEVVDDVPVSTKKAQEIVTKSNAATDATGKADS